MADGFEGDDEDFYDGEDEWLYVEDDFALTDELAESQIANPGYPGTNYEIAVEGYEFDLFEYWNDLEYADNALWDDSRQAHKRKRRDGLQPRSAAKKHKAAGHTALRGGTDDGVYDPVLFYSRSERNWLCRQSIPAADQSLSYALFPDWGRRLAATPRFTTQHTLPSMIDAESESESEPDGQGGTESLADEEHEPEHNLDHGVLQMVLKEKLGQAGLDGLNEAAFMQAINDLMSGKGGVDRATGDLASTLLDTLAQGSNGDVLSSWLSAQGVSIEAQGEDGNGIAESTSLPAAAVGPPDSSQSASGSGGKRGRETRSSGAPPLAAAQSRSKRRASPAENCELPEQRKRARRRGS